MTLVYESKFLKITKFKAKQDGGKEFNLRDFYQVHSLAKWIRAKNILDLNLEHNLEHFLGRNSANFMKTQFRTQVGTWVSNSFL